MRLNVSRGQHSGKWRRAQLLSKLLARGLPHAPFISTHSTHTSHFADVLDASQTVRLWSSAEKSKLVLRSKLEACLGSDLLIAPGRCTKWTRRISAVLVCQQLSNGSDASFCGLQMGADSAFGRGFLCNPACSLNRLPLLSAYQRKLFLFLLIRILLVVLHSQRIFYQRNGFHVFSLVKRTATIFKNWPNPTQRYSVLLIQEVWKIRQLGKYSHKIQVSRPWLRRVVYIFFTWKRKRVWKSLSIHCPKRISWRSMSDRKVREKRLIAPSCLKARFGEKRKPDFSHLV